MTGFQIFPQAFPGNEGIGVLQVAPPFAAPEAGRQHRRLSGQIA